MAGSATLVPCGSGSVHSRFSVTQDHAESRADLSAWSPVVGVFYARRTRNPGSRWLPVPVIEKRGSL
ncbi:MAG: hypothetical protein CMF72_06920 [Mameliella sp.]|nr:hypothetical protein [Mameliella sp.]